MPHVRGCFWPVSHGTPRFFGDMWKFVQNSLTFKLWKVTFHFEFCLYIQQNGKKRSKCYQRRKSSEIDRETVHVENLFSMCYVARTRDVGVLHLNLPTVCGGLVHTVCSGDWFTFSCVFESGVSFGLLVLARRTSLSLECLDH